MKRLIVRNLNGAQTHMLDRETQEELDAHIAKHSGKSFGKLERLKPTTECSQEELDIAIGTEMAEDAFGNEVEHKRLPQMFTIECSYIADPTPEDNIEYNNTNLPESSKYTLNESLKSLSGTESEIKREILELKNRIDLLQETLVSNTKFYIIEDELFDKADKLDVELLKDKFFDKADKLDIALLEEKLLDRIGDINLGLLENRVWDNKNDLSELKQSFGLLAARFDKLIEATTSFAEQLDTDATAQNSAVTNSQLDNNYKSSFINKL